MTVSKTLLGIALLIAIVVVAKTKEAPLILGVLVVAGIAFTVFKPIFAGLKIKRTLNSVRFDTTGHKLIESPPGLRSWQTPEGDFLGLRFFPRRPDLPADAPNTSDFAALLRAQLQAGGAKLVELKFVRADGCSAVSMVASIPQQSGGLTYIGTLTLPFRDCSFQLECQCPERGITGVREAILFDRMAGKESPIRKQNGAYVLDGDDPDAEKYDVQFPQHPVSRARRVMAHVVESLIVSDKIRKLPSFSLPEF